MIYKDLGNLVLRLYGSVEELPTERYHKFNMYCLLAAGIGTDIESVQNHIVDIFRSLEKKDFERLKVQFKNYYHCLNLILEGTDIRSWAFVCLIESINGKKITDLSEESIAKISKRLQRADDKNKLLGLYRELKKKLRTR